jgi:Na+/H+ antiporter NhaC
MAWQDVDWGSVVVGAAIATTIVAFSISNPPLFLIADAIGVPATIIGGASIGGVVGEFTHDLLMKTQNAITAVARA